MKLQLAGIGDPLVALVVTTLATVAIGTATVMLFDHITPSKGYYDRTTEF